MKRTILALFATVGLVACAHNNPNENTAMNPPTEQQMPPQPPSQPSSVTLPALKRCSTRRQAGQCLAFLAAMQKV